MHSSSFLVTYALSLMNRLLLLVPPLSISETLNDWSCTLICDTACAGFLGVLIKCQQLAK